MVLIATLCFWLQEITTPALGAPPLLNQEGNCPKHFHFPWRAEVSYASVRKGFAIAWRLFPNQPPLGPAQFVRVVRSFGVFSRSL